MNDEHVEFVKKAYEFVRDEISHSWDIQSSRITCKASETLFFREGICYAKSNLMCALLRSKGIPTGFCYQRLTIGDTPDTGYCIHALNAVYLKSLGRWVRLDARGNKVGISAEFSINEEKLAFSLREEYNEVDYSEIYKQPNPKTMKAELNMTEGSVWTVPATEIAMRILGRGITNTAMLGVVARATGIVEMESIEKAVKDRFPQPLAEKNIGVIKEAYKEATSE